MLQSLIDYWPGWLGLGGTVATLATLIAGASWIPGVGTVLAIGVSILQMISPLVNGVLTLLMWTLSNVIFPGVKNIFSNLSTVITVILMGVFLWFGLIARYEVKLAQKSYVISKCPTPIQEPEVDNPLPWPFNWK